MKRIIVILLCILYFDFSYGQIYPFTKDYLLNKNALIPASGAEDNFLSVALTYDKKWILPASPNRANLYVNANFRHHGFNLGFSRNQVVIFYSSAIQLGYYYKMIIKRYRISLGVNGLILQDRLALENLPQNEITDPAIENLPKLIFYPQLGLSAFVYTDKMEMGFSLANILKARGYTYGDLNTIYPMQINFYGALFYKHPLEYYLLKAKLYTYYSFDKAFFIEPSASFMIKNFLKAGGLVNVYYQKANKNLGAGIILGIRLKNRIVVNYVFRYIMLGNAISYTRMDNGISVVFNFYRESEVAPRYF